MEKSNNTTPWTSKIVGHDRVAPDTLVANPHNHRTHPQQQRDALAASIRDVGFIRSVTVNKTTGNLIDGHERLVQAIETNQEFIDVEYVELSDRDASGVANPSQRSVSKAGDTQPGERNGSCAVEREPRPGDTWRTRPQPAPRDAARLVDV